MRLQPGPWVGNLHATVHVFAGGLVPAGTAEVLERGRLSDHAPVRVSLAAP